jgi:hypothetical protein
MGWGIEGRILGIDSGDVTAGDAELYLPLRYWSTVVSIAYRDPLLPLGQ